MAVPRALGGLLLDLARRHAWSGSVLQLGRQVVYMTEREVRGRFQLPAPLHRYVDDAAFFEALGFGEVHASDLEGVGDPTHVLDLNQPAPPHLVNRYDAVYEGGTVGCVFDVATALRTIEAVLRPGGRVIHAVAANGYVDEGFFAFSPRLLHEWYRVRGYAIEASLIVEHSRRWRRGAMRAFAYEPGVLDRLTIAGLERGAMLHVIVARRPEAPVEAIPYLPSAPRTHSRLARVGLLRRAVPALLPLLPSRVVRVVPRRMPPRAGRW